MEDILRAISNVVGVNGCFVCDEAGDILAVSLRTLARDHSLSVVGYTAAQAIAGLRASKRKKVDIDLVYAGGRVILKPLQGGCLCIVCEPRISVPLLSLTADVAVPKLQAALKGRPAAPPPVMPRAPAPVPQPQPQAPAPTAAPPPETTEPQTKGRGLNGFLRNLGR
jgi:hypothetical protein